MFSLVFSEEELFIVDVVLMLRAIFKKLPPAAGAINFDRFSSIYSIRSRFSAIKRFSGIYDI